MLTGRVEKVVNLIQFNSNCRFGNLHWGMVKNVVKSTWFNSNQMIWLLYSKPVILRVYMQGTYKIYHNLLWIDLTKDESSWIESDWMKVYLYHLLLQIDFQLFYILRTRKVRLLMPFYFQYIDAQFNFCWVDLFMLSFSHLLMPIAFQYVNTQFDFQ